jgi:hypothetical protein
MIDELGHESALPSLLGTNRAGLGELRVDLATPARQGKSSWGLSFPLTIERLSRRAAALRQDRHPGLRACRRSRE